MSMDPANGHVKAYVGGPNYVYFQYDMAMVGRRQVGSTIKPYLYTLAMENGFSPCDQARHVEQTLIDENGTPWTCLLYTSRQYKVRRTLSAGLLYHIQFVGVLCGCGSSYSSWTGRYSASYEDYIVCDGTETGRCV